MDTLDAPSNLQDAFKAFISNKSLLALPLSLYGTTVRDAKAVQCIDTDHTSQVNLNLLEHFLSPTISVYLLLRRRRSILAITFTPYRSPQNERNKYLRYQHALVKLLGEEQFDSSLICKEIGEITDARSWTEREQSRNKDPGLNHLCAYNNPHEGKQESIADLKYEKNKCRLCDRRMKNNITMEALAALNKLEDMGSLVQISLDVDVVLVLGLAIASVQPEVVSLRLPVTHPTFTFYRHPNTRLYFIFHSPDCATVQQRMKHTISIPGLVNVHAKDCGVRIDQKIEIHEPEDLTFDEGDEKIGKFRSMYLRGGWQGTESQYDGRQRDIEFYNKVR